MSFEILPYFSGYLVDNIPAKNDGDICNYFVCRELIRKTPFICVDIGVDVGAWTKMIKNVDSWREVHAFEPNPDSYANLKTLFNDLSGVYLYPYAISKTTGTVRFEKAGAQSKICEDGSVEIVTKPLFDVLGEGTQIGILKIDTEGHDAIILESIIPNLENIHTIITEWTPHEYGNNKNEAYHTSKELLDKYAMYYPYIYALSREGAPFVVSLESEEQRDEFLTEHLLRKMQTDLVFTNSPIEKIAVVPFEPRKWYA